MRSVLGLVAAGVALMILAFNPQIVQSGWNMVYGPIESWSKDGSDDIGAKRLLIKAPKFPGDKGEVAAPRYMRSDEPTPSQEGKAGEEYGAGAVAVQRAKGL